MVELSKSQCEKLLVTAVTNSKNIEAHGIEITEIKKQLGELYEKMISEDRMRIVFIEAADKLLREHSGTCAIGEVKKKVEWLNSKVLMAIGGLTLAAFALGWLIRK